MLGIGLIAGWLAWFRSEPRSAVLGAIGTLMVVVIWRLVTRQQEQIRGERIDPAEQVFILFVVVFTAPVAMIVTSILAVFLFPDTVGSILFGY